METVTTPAQHSVKSICEFFWDLEKRYHLFQQTERGVFYWKLIRFNLYYNLIQTIGLFGAPHPGYGFEIRKIVANNLSFLKAAVPDNAFLAAKPHPFIVMPHIRQTNGVDVYSDALVEALPHDKTLILYRDHLAVRYDGSVTMQGSLFKNRLLRKLSRNMGRGRNLSTQTQTILATIQQDIADRFHVTYDLWSMTEREIDLFERDRGDYSALFRKQQIQKLFITIAYHNHAAVAAAQDLGAQVTELQHGTFTRYHLGYSFPESDDAIPYFPDRLFTFGQFWSDHTPLPAKTRCQTIGAPYLERLSSVHGGDGDGRNIKTPHQVLVASQGVIGRYLYPFMVVAARLNPDYRFIFRLHPSESLADYQIMEKDLSAPSNLVLSTKTPDIYSLLNESAYQIGVFSTTLLEAMKMGCKTICIDLPGVEYMIPCIERGDALLVKTPEDLAEALENAAPCQNPTYYYAVPANDIGHHL